MQNITNKIFLDYVNSIDRTLNEKDVDTGLNHSDPIIRLGFVEMNDLHVSEDQVNKLLNDPEWQIRCAIIKKYSLYLTDKQIELVFNDPSVHVRITAFERFDHLLTDEVRNKWEKDKSPEIRALFFSMVAPNLSPLTNEQLANGLSDGAPLVRSAAASYSGDIVISPDNTEKALNDSSIDVVRNMVLNHKSELRGEQIHRLLESKYPLVRKAVAIRGAQPGRYNEISMSQVKDGLNDSDVAVRCAFARYTTLALLDKDPLVRLSVFDDISCSLNHNELERALKDTNPRVRAAVVKHILVARKSTTGKKGMFLSKEQLDRGLKDSDPSVRKGVFEITGTQLTEDEIEAGLTDESEDIRAYCSTLGVYKLTAEQIKRGLNDKHPLVRSAFYSLNLDFTKKQISIGLSDCGNVVKAIIDNANIKLTKKQIENALVHRDPLVRISIVNRRDVALNANQIDRGLKDIIISVRSAVYNRYGQYLSDEQRAILIDDPYLRCSDKARIISLPDTKLTKKQVTNLISDRSYLVVASLASNNSYTPNQEQVDVFLDNEYYGVGLAVLNRGDINLTPKQMTEIRDYHLYLGYPSEQLIENARC